jgi:hypothetical protein
MSIGERAASGVARCLAAIAEVGTALREIDWRVRPARRLASAIRRICCVCQRRRRRVRLRAVARIDNKIKTLPTENTFFFQIMFVAISFIILLSIQLVCCQCPSKPLLQFGDLTFQGGFRIDPSKKGLFIYCFFFKSYYY